eukprot:10412873-Prorocentrum_lima.AAC.1
MTSSLVGSEMCIRDRYESDKSRPTSPSLRAGQLGPGPSMLEADTGDPVSYTHLTLPTICSV